MSQPYYGPCIDHLVTLADGDLTVWHANFAAHAPSASLLAGFAAPATEVVGFYFSASVSDSEKSSFESNLDKFVKVMEEKAKGYRGAIGGWVIEEVEHPEIEGKAKLWQTMARWDSVEAHMAFRETDDFKNNVHLLRPEFIKAVTMHHCRFQTI